MAILRPRVECVDKLCWKSGGAREGFPVGEAYKCVLIGWGIGFSWEEIVRCRAAREAQGILVAVV